MNKFKLEKNFAIAAMRQLLPIWAIMQIYSRCFVAFAKRKAYIIMRIGFGYDVHKLTADRRLILGGIEIPHEMGLLGYSDADVLTHAIMDALLGALALGDIGRHFPDNDKSFKDIDSMILLAKVREILREHKYCVSNIDSTICAQRPKLMPYIEQMQEKIAEVLEIPVGKVSVKATTTEKLGFVGNEEGMSAYAVCLLEEK